MNILTTRHYASVVYVVAMSVCLSVCSSVGNSTIGHIRLPVIYGLSSGTNSNDLEGTFAV